jgi:hypothetical protein
LTTTNQTTNQLFEKFRKELIQASPLGLKDCVLNGGGGFAAGMALVLAFQLGELSSHRDDQTSLQEIVSAHIRSLMA